MLVLVVTDDAESTHVLGQCLLIKLGCEVVVVLKGWWHENNGERREKAWGKKKFS